MYNIKITYWVYFYYNRESTKGTYIIKAFMIVGLWVLDKKIEKHCLKLPILLAFIRYVLSPQLFMRLPILLLPNRFFISALTISAIKPDEGQLLLRRKITLRKITDSNDSPSTFRKVGPLLQFWICILLYGLNAYQMVCQTQLIMLFLQPSPDYSILLLNTEKPLLVGFVA